MKRDQRNKWRYRSKSWNTSSWLTSGESEDRSGVGMRDEFKSIEKKENKIKTKNKQIPSNKELLVDNTSLVFMQLGVWHIDSSGQSSRETSYEI